MMNTLDKQLESLAGRWNAAALPVLEQSRSEVLEQIADSRRPRMAGFIGLSILVVAAIGIGGWVNTHETVAVLPQATVENVVAARSAPPSTPSTPSVERNPPTTTAGSDSRINDEVDQQGAVETPVTVETNTSASEVNVTLENPSFVAEYTRLITIASASVNDPVKAYQFYQGAARLSASMDDEVRKERALQSAKKILHQHPEISSRVD